MSHFRYDGDRGMLKVTDVVAESHTPPSPPVCTPTIQTVTDLALVGLPPSLDVPAGVRRLLRAIADMAPRLKPVGGKAPQLTLRTRDYDLLQTHFPTDLYWGPVRLLRGQPEDPSIIC